MESSAFTFAANVVGFALLLKALLYRVETIIRQRLEQAPSQVSLEFEDPELVG